MIIAIVMLVIGAVVFGAIYHRILQQHRARFAADASDCARDGGKVKRDGEDVVCLINGAKLKIGAVGVVGDLVGLQ